MKRNMLKKCLALGLASVMGLTCFTGFGGLTKEVQAAEETKKIIMTFVTGGVDPVALPQVQAAINEISVPEIGVEVEFKTVSVFEIPSKCPMWIGGREQIDLMAVAFTGLESYINQNMIQPIDDLLQYAPHLEEMNAAGDPIYYKTNEGTTYGALCIATILGNAGGLLVNNDMLKEAGLSYEDNQMVTLDDLDEIFAVLKEKFPDSYPLYIAGKDPSARYYTTADALGGTLSSGVLETMDSTTVVNYFETETYKEYLEHMREWYQAGYVMKDAATTDVSLEDGVANKTFVSYFTEGNQGLINVLENNTGMDFIRLMFNEPYRTAITPSANTYWTIPVTAKEPEAAMKFLNLMNENKDVNNLLNYGIEGYQYEVTDAENEVIANLEGVADYIQIGLYGDQRIMYQIGSNPKKEDAAWNETSLKNTSVGYGFLYDSSAMNNQIIAVDSVINEYRPALETGSADLEKIYPEFIEKLKANGIEDIIADKQAQFDAWLASK